MIYIDLNMVRAGVVKHPSEWPDCGYHEITRPRLRYSVINHRLLMDLAGIDTPDSFIKTYTEWLGDSLKRKAYEHQLKWSASIAVGSEMYIDGIKDQLGIRAAYRKKIKSQDACVLCEPVFPYSAGFVLEKDVLRTDNIHYWNTFSYISTG